MDQNFRHATLQHLVKQAGVVSDMVDKALEVKNKVLNFISIGSVGPGTTVMVPPNPVKPDGSVDIVFQIRGLAGGDTKTAGSMGANAVIITAEAGGLGSKENLAAFGSPAFVNKAVGQIISAIQSKNPDKKIVLGKLVVSSFSGGGSATASLLVNRGALPKGTTPPKFVFIDGLHADPKGQVMKEIVNYAKEVKNNPAAGELSIVHTAVVPGGYASTTQVADHLLQELGLQRQRVSDKQGEGDDVRPVAEAQSGGLKVVQLYDQQQPYMAKDPRTGEMKPNVPGTAGKQHINALTWSIKNMI